MIAPLLPPTSHAYAQPPILQVRDRWGFQLTARYDLYARQLADYTRLDYKQQIVRDPSLD